MHDVIAGHLEETDEGYQFVYLNGYTGDPVSITMPVTTEPYRSMILFPFFDGLIPEGWLLEIAGRNWKLDPRDRMGLLLTCCKECIGAVSVTDVTP